MVHQNTEVMITMVQSTTITNTKSTTITTVQISVIMNLAMDTTPKENTMSNYPMVDYKL